MHRELVRKAVVLPLHKVHLTPRLVDAAAYTREISSLGRLAPGGPTSATTSCTVSMYHGEPNPMPGNGRLAPITSTGAFPERQPWVGLWICSRGYKGLMVWDM